MSYQRYNHDLQWFNAKSTEYVFGREDYQIEDYGSCYDHLPSLVELVGRMVMGETKDFGYATKIVVALAYKLKISHKLRRENYPYEELETGRGHDYRKEMAQWISFFDDTPSARTITWDYPDDDISDFDYLQEFTEDELYEVKS